MSNQERYFVAIIEIDAERFKAHCDKIKINIDILQAYREIDDVFLKYNILKLHGWYRGDHNTTQGIFFKVLSEASETLTWFRECVGSARIMRVDADDDMMEFFG